MKSRHNSLGVTLMALTIFLLAGQVVAQGGTWETKAPMPTARSSHAIGVINGQLYVVGGDSIPDDPNEAYDPVSDTWTRKAPIPTPRRFLAAAAIDGKLYVVGGCVNQTCSFPATNALEVYNPATDTWTVKTPMPTPRSGMGAAAIDGKLYVVGGASSGFNFNRLEVYDPVTDTWATKTGMPGQRTGVGAAAIDGKLYVVGGLAGFDFTITDKLQVYDPATDTWQTKTPMPTPRAILGVGVINGKLHVVGGNGFTCLDTVCDTHEVYDPLTDTWTTETPMPRRRARVPAGVINGKLYVPGGLDCIPFVPCFTVNVLEVFTSVIPFAAFDAKVEITLGPLANDDSFEVKSTFTLGTGSDGIDPLTEDVSFQVGTFSTTIPAGSFKFHPANSGKGKGKGAPARWTFEGVIDGVELEAKITDLGGGSFEFKAEGESADLTGTVNPVTVTLTIGDDGGSTTVEAEFE